MNIINEYDLDNHLALTILSDSDFNDFLVVELSGLLDAGNADQAIDIIDSQMQPLKGIVLLLENLKFSSTAGYGLFLRIIKREQEAQRRTIMIGLKGQPRSRIAESRVNLLELCEDYDLVSEFLDHERNSSKTK